MVQGPVSNRRFSRRQVRQATIAGAVVIGVLVAGIGGWFFYQSSKSSSIETSQQETEQQAKAMAQPVAAYFADIVGKLGEYAADPRIRSLFESADPAQLEAEAQAAKTVFPSALKVRLLRPGAYEVDNNSTPPLTYGSLDILGKAERTNGTIAAEVLLFGTDNQHIVLVERVKDQADQLTGLIHLSLQVDLIKEALAGANPGAAYIEIRQSTAKEPLVLASAGNAELKTGEPVTTSISGTLWTLAYWGDNSMLAMTGSEGGGGSLMLIAAIAVVLLGVAVAFVMKKKTGGASAAETSAKPDIRYTGAIRAIMDGAHPGMEKLIANMPERDPTAPRHVPGISSGMIGDDITMIMKKDDLKAAMAGGDAFDPTGGGAAPAASQPKPAAKPAPKPAAKPATSPAAAKPAAPAPAAPAAAPAASAGKEIKIPEVIFRKYDIRGVVGKTLTNEAALLIGKAVGSVADKALQKKVVVGRDGRLSSPDIAENLIKGLRAAGRDVIDIGVVPTPVLYFATHHLQTKTGVMVTGSHNGPEYNGLKIVVAGDTLSEEGIRDLYNRIVNNDFVTGEGSLDTAEVIADYIRRITDDIPVAIGRSYRMVVDCGNGAAGVVAPELYRALGHDVIEMYCDLDGRFPNHHPDPGEPKNMQHMIERIRQEKADFGFAFDGDGDRLGVVDSEGNIIWPDRQLMVFARDVLSRNPGAPIIYDVKCTNHLRRAIEAAGGKAVMWKTGHSLIKSKMKSMSAPLAGEMSGHIFFKERWYGFDDAIYSGARLLEILMNSKTRPTDFFAAIPESVSTPELKIDLPESEHATFMRGFESMLAINDAEIVNVDGFRIEFADGWGLIRPSNTTPCLVVRFEADNEAALERIKTIFRELVLSVNPALKVPF